MALAIAKSLERAHASWTSIAELTTIAKIGVTDENRVLESEYWKRCKN